MNNNKPTNQQQRDELCRGENFTVTPRVIKGKLYWRIEDDKGGLFDEVPVGQFGLKKFGKMYG
jgi:hypothetical protein|tara:strand:+ start:392 stop:580 length:189 start_codon:yes stop_codon:yes gene_type:complete